MRKMIDDQTVAESMQINVCCGNCIAYVELPQTGGQGGECHLNPPAVIVVTSSVLTKEGRKEHINTVFPPVPVTSWCCHFRPKP